jgi:hypothetical protein
MPNKTVNNKPWVVWLKLFSINLWWAHVTVNPEVNKINVLSNGICIGLKVWIPFGGHNIPNSIVGDNLLWKNPQKKEIKKKTSEVINKIIPHRRPIVTVYVCNPWKVPSRVISRHHWYIIINVIKDPSKNKLLLNIWNHLMIPIIVIIALKAPKIGQGLTSTKW